MACEPAGSMAQLHRLSSNLYFEPNQANLILTHISLRSIIVPPPMPKLS